MALKIRKLFNTMGDNCIMQDIDDYISSIIGNRKISEELGKWLIKKSQYVRKRIVLTLPVSNRQGIFLPISEQKNLKKDKKSVKIRTISSEKLKIRINQYKQGIIIIDVFLYFLHQKSPKCSS